MADTSYNNNIAVGPENNGVTTLNMAIATPGHWRTIHRYHSPAGEERRYQQSRQTGRALLQPSELADFAFGLWPVRGLHRQRHQQHQHERASEAGREWCRPYDSDRLGHLSVGLVHHTGTATNLPYTAEHLRGSLQVLVRRFFRCQHPEPQVRQILRFTNHFRATVIGSNNTIQSSRAASKSTIKARLPQELGQTSLREILKLGWTGRNINPIVPGVNGWPNSGNPVSPNEPNLATLSASGGQVPASGPTANSGISTTGCNTDPSPNAVIRLARIRDNPSNAGSGNNYCGNNPSSKAYNSGGTNQTATCSGTTNGTNCPSQHGSDYWPNALYDTREGLVRDSALAGNAVTLGGTMYYVELDVANLAKWFAGTIGTSGGSVSNTTGYSVYFSDRRGDRNDPSPPASVGTTAMLTGGYGYDDFVNPASGSGCPNGTLDQGEDVESDYVSGVSQNSGTTPRTYGGTPTLDNSASATVAPLSGLTLNAAGVLADKPELCWD